MKTFQPIPYVMQFSDKQIENFRTLYKNRFGVELERKAAFEYAEKLFRMMEIIYVQISASDFETLQKRRKQINHSKP